MAVLLCRQLAKQPYYHEKLDLHIWSEQELCYVIYRYPLLSLDGLVNDSLIRWLAECLGMRALAKRLSEERKNGERTENLLLLILQECNYETAAEISAFKETVIRLRRYSREDYLHEQGTALFALRRYKRAENLFLEAKEALDEHIRAEKEPAEKKKLQQKKADFYCDLAAVSMQLFNKKRALEALYAAELCAKTKRVLKMRYLISGEGPISEEDRRAADSVRAAARAEALEHPDCIALAELFSKEKEEIIRGSGERIAAWKKSYRRML